MSEASSDGRAAEAARRTVAFASGALLVWLLAAPGSLVAALERSCPVDVSWLTQERLTRVRTLLVIALVLVLARTAGRREPRGQAADGADRPDRALAPELPLPVGCLAAVLAIIGFFSGIEALGRTFGAQAEGVPGVDRLLEGLVFGTVGAGLIVLARGLAWRRRWAWRLAHVGSLTLIGLCVLSLARMRPSLGAGTGVSGPDLWLLVWLVLALAALVVCIVLWRCRWALEPAGRAAPASGGAGAQPRGESGNPEPR